MLTTAISHARFAPRMVALGAAVLTLPVAAHLPPHAEWALRSDMTTLTLFKGRAPKIYQICADRHQSIEPLYILLDGDEEIVHPVNKNQACIDVEASEITLLLKRPGKARGSYVCLNCAP